MTARPALVNVTGHTRAGDEGRELVCPDCGSTCRVYHFSWSAIWCVTCDQMVVKTDWLTTS